MPFQKGNTLAKGIGRSNGINERKRTVGINKSWDIVNEFLNDPKSDPKEKRDLAIKIVVKSIPQDITSKDEKIGGIDIFEYVQYLKDRNNNSDKKDTTDEQANPSVSGGNVS